MRRPPCLCHCPAVSAGSREAGLAAVSGEILRDLTEHTRFCETSLKSWRQPLLVLCGCHWRTVVWRHKGVGWQRGSAKLTLRGCKKIPREACKGQKGRLFHPASRNVCTYGANRLSATLNLTLYLQATTIWGMSTIKCHNGLTHAPPMQFIITFLSYLFLQGVKGCVHGSFPLHLSSQNPCVVGRLG